MAAAVVSVCFVVEVCSLSVGVCVCVHIVEVEGGLGAFMHGFD